MVLVSFTVISPVLVLDTGSSPIPGPCGLCPASDPGPCPVSGPSLGPRSVPVPGHGSDPGPGPG